MLAYDSTHILHTAVAYFHVIFVKKAVIFMLTREVFRYKFKKGFAYVSFYIAAEGRVIPDNVTLSVTF